MTNRKLIINADDFGVCEASNAAIVEIFERGTISSTTLMTPCPAAEQAVKIALANPAITVGLHITTTGEWSGLSWGPLSGGASLMNSDGNFHPDVKSFADHAASEEVSAELEAQYTFMTSRGLMPTHADSHMGSVYGLTGVTFMRETLEFCARHNLPFRFPKNFDNISRFVRSETIPDSLRMLHEQVVLGAAALGVNLIDNLASCDVPFEDLNCYEDVKNAYMALIAGLPVGVSEVFLHPSLDDPRISKDNPKWRVRQWEHRFLLDDDLPRLLAREGIELTAYHKAW